MKELSGSTLKMALVHNEINYVRQLKLSKQGIDHYYSYQFSKNLKNSENGLKYDLVVFCSSAYIQTNIQLFKDQFMIFDTGMFLKTNYFRYLEPLRSTNTTALFLKINTFMKQNIFNLLNFLHPKNESFQQLAEVFKIENGDSSKQKVYVFYSQKQQIIRNIHILTKYLIQGDPQPERRKIQRKKKDVQWGTLNINPSLKFALQSVEYLSLMPARALSKTEYAWNIPTTFQIVHPMRILNNLIKKGSTQAQVDKMIEQYVDFLLDFNLRKVSNPYSYLKFESLKYNTELIKSKSDFLHARMSLKYSNKHTKTKFILKLFGLDKNFSSVIQDYLDHCLEICELEVEMMKVYRKIKFLKIEDEKLINEHRESISNEFIDEGSLIYPYLYTEEYSKDGPELSPLQIKIIFKYNLGRFSQKSGLLDPVEELELAKQLGLQDWGLNYAYKQSLLMILEKFEHIIGVMSPDIKKKMLTFEQNLGSKKESKMLKTTECKIGSQNGTKKSDKEDEILKFSQDFTSLFNGRDSKKSAISHLSFGIPTKNPYVEAMKQKEMEEMLLTADVSDDGRMEEEFRNFGSFRD